MDYPFIPQTLIATERGIALAVSLQSLELLLLRTAWESEGVWAWSLLQRDFESSPRPLRFFFTSCLEPRGFLTVLTLRLLAALALLLFSGAAYPGVSALPLALLLTSTLVSVRWRGSFNGGSDSMTLLILLALSIARGFEGSDRIAAGCLTYIALQACLSYFISGGVKLRDRDWRSGKALRSFLERAPYDLPEGLRSLAARPGACLLLSWAVICFECAFPLALTGPIAAGLFIGLALAFHLANFYAFGLNRFLFAWLASYPALYALSLSRF